MDQSSVDYIAKIIAELNARDMKRIQEGEFEERKKMLTSVFNEAARYTNIVIVAGYVAFFTLLSKIEAAMSIPLVLWACVLMLVSAFTFVGFEIGKMVFHTIIFKRNAKALKVSTTAALDAVTAANQETSKAVMAMWGPIILIAAGTGFTAVGMLAYHIFMKAIGTI